MKIKLLFVLALFLFLSCSNNDDNSITNEEKSLIENPDNLKDNSDICSEKQATNPDFTGTACCIQRNSNLSLTEIIEYEYFTNLENPVIGWEVFSGDIEIVSDSNSNKVSIKLGSNFTEAKLRGFSSSSVRESENCGLGVTISKL